MTSSLSEYAALGVQDESPLRPDTYFSSNINGTGLKAMDTLTFAYGFMIGAALTGPAPVGGILSGATAICIGNHTTLTLEGYSGYIKWQSTSDGGSTWAYVTEGIGMQDQYTTPDLMQSMSYRAEVFQPGHEPVFSNSVFVEALPETPTINASGDVLISSAISGNQWYDANGLITGATGQYYFATSAGQYFVVVTIDTCISLPSNTIELITVSLSDQHLNSDYTIYPNPFHDEIVIEAQGQLNSISYKILNAFGQLVQAGLFRGREAISTSYFVPGVYVVAIQDGKVEYRKIVERVRSEK